MPSFFKIVQLLCIPFLLGAPAWASSGVKCQFTQGPVGFGYRVACDKMPVNWYQNFDAALVDLYAAERHGVISFDWDQIHAQCREQHQRPEYCDRL